LLAYDGLVGEGQRTHITFALLFRGLWHLDSKEPQLKEALRKYREIDRCLSLVRESPEVYATKETLERRLERRIHDGYDGLALQRFDPLIKTYSETQRLKRLAEFRAAMNELIMPQILKATSFSGPFVDASCHIESQRCDACPESVRVLQEVEEFQADLQSMHSLRSDSHHQVDSSEEVKQ